MGTAVERLSIRVADGTKFDRIRFTTQQEMIDYMDKHVASGHSFHVESTRYIRRDEPLTVDNLQWIVHDG